MNATAQTSRLLNMLKPQEAPVVHSQGWSVMDGDECAAGKLASFGTEEEATHRYLGPVKWDKATGQPVRDVEYAHVRGVYDTRHGAAYALAKWMTDCINIVTEMEPA